MTLQVAIRQEKKAFIEMFLKAFHSGRLSSSPGSLAVVLEQFDVLYDRYPQLFLEFIMGMPMTPASEVLSDFTKDITIKKRLVCGSEHMSPSCLWDSIIPERVMQRKNHQVLGENGEGNGDDGTDNSVPVSPNNI